ncbi:MAG: hypothetical protein AABM31_10285 [Actinomycetota bacterium]
MSGRHDPVLVGVAGFLLGGVIVDSFTEVASVFIAGGTLGGMAGAIYGAMRQEADAEHAAGAGGAVGLVAASFALLIDALAKA